MSTPASFVQVSKLIETLGKPTAEAFQYLNANGDLVKAMLEAGPRLADVDRTAFSALLATVRVVAPVTIAWTLVSQYTERITARSKLRGWGLTETQIAQFAESVRRRDHAGPLHPLGVSLWLGRDFAYNYDEMIAWLRDEVMAQGVNFYAYHDSARVSFLPGSEISGESKLAAVNLDLNAFWYRTKGTAIPRNVRELRSRWPGLEVGWLLCLNPQVYLAIDYEVIPNFVAGGLRVDSDHVLQFYCGRDGAAYVNVHWVEPEWGGDSLVAFGG